MADSFTGFPQKFHRILRQHMILKVGCAVSQLVEELRYKPEGPRFDPRWGHWNFSSVESIRPHYGPEVQSTSNRNVYQEYLLGRKDGRSIRLTTLPH